MLDFEKCWDAVQKRDAAQDGKFYFGVVTTGVYCRPSCPARRPLRRNVRFFERPSDAERQGLRPCLRCRPLLTPGADVNNTRILDVCRFIEAHSDAPLKTADLAKRAGLSRFHFQRSFKTVTGLTPSEYLESMRLSRLKNGLRAAKDVTEAVYEAGYGSSSRVYERADTRLGMTPKQYRNGGAGVTITHVTVDSPVGPMMVGATDRGLCFVQFGGNGEQLLAQLRREYPNARYEAMREPYPPEFHRWMESLNNHLAGVQPRLDLPLDIRATAFQMRVWKYLQSIPYGQVQSYSEVAAAIGQPSAARAVARACAANKVAIVIPCHRVIRGTGELGGYRWGLEVKRTLLDRERAAT
jgi:AraC family transcriptional regulator of adaptative response/methylated-DNA-[protein]-cysteine methyltransferase